MAIDNILRSFDQNLKNKFNERCFIYDEYRPVYLDALFEDIFQMKALDHNSEALEIGIGTGQATKPILETGCNLLALEIGDQLASFTKEKFQNYSNFNVENSSFEDSSLNDNSYDLVFSASAFHWIPESFGYSKVFRILKPNGVFARFANHPYPAKDNIELFEAIQQCYKKHLPESKPGIEYTEEKARARADLSEKYGFIDTKYYVYNRIRTHSAQEYVKLLETMHDHIALDDNLREMLFNDIEATIMQFGNQIKVYDTIDLQLARKANVVE
jgi:ubiquinone/menaquinone biosynthesis C-methylase UbiE